MILTLRTVPRSDGRTSVVLTRSPSSPSDPELLTIERSSRLAVHWILNEITRLENLLGDRVKGYESRCLVQTDGPCSATVKLRAELGPTEFLKTVP